jgi:hypothetical protein
MFLGFKGAVVQLAMSSFLQQELGTSLFFVV